jgi:sporulation-control protein spo0M
LLTVKGIGATARIFVVLKNTVSFPTKGIEVAISVQIGKGGGAVKPNINAIEGLAVLVCSL